MFYRVVRNIRPLAQCGRNINRGLCTKRNVPIRYGWGSDPWDGFLRDPFRRHGPMDRQFWRMVDRMMKPFTFDTYYMRPQYEQGARSDVAQVKYDKESFEVKIDVQNFTPEELDVKLAGNRLSITGKHEKKTDEHGYISREFSREFDIPEDVNLETVKSSLSEDGFLTVKANLIQPEKPPEKTIEIDVEQKPKS